MIHGTASRRCCAGGRFRFLTGALLALAGGGPVLAAGQIKLEGEVLDALTGLPVAGVIVHFPDLDIGSISDEFGYFMLESVPRGVQIVAVHRVGYEALMEEVRVVPGEIWEVRVTPAAVSVAGIEVSAATGPEREAALTGRRADFISPSQVAEAAERTNKVLEVLRSKAPPRLQIQQQGGRGGVTFCIQSTRRTPSVQELRDLGTGCRPALLALDGVIVYSPPAMTEMANVEPPSLPADVAALLLNQNPREVRSIRILSPTDAFFRYGAAGRLGAVEITTVHPGRPKGS